MHTRCRFSYLGIFKWPTLSLAVSGRLPKRNSRGRPQREDMEDQWTIREDQDTHSFKPLSRIQTSNVPNCIPNCWVSRIARSMGVQNCPRIVPNCSSAARPVAGRMADWLSIGRAGLGSCGSARPPATLRASVRLRRTSPSLGRVLPSVVCLRQTFPTCRRAGR